MAGIFQTEALLKGSYAGLTRQIQIGDGPMESACIQNIQASVGVQIQTFYEVGSNNAYRIAGRPQGQGQLSNIVGPTDASYKWMKKLCTICNTGEQLVIKTVNSCTGTSARRAGNGTLTFTGCIATNVSVTVDAAQDIINGNLTLMFMNLNVSD